MGDIAGNCWYDGCTNAGGCEYVTGPADANVAGGAYWAGVAWEYIIGAYYAKKGRNIFSAMKLLTLDE